MMRYMWICNRKLSPSAVQEEMNSGHTGGVVKRLMRTQTRACWVLVTNLAGWEFAMQNELNDPQSDHWTISGCNKQYAVNVKTKKYLGCLAEVSVDEAKRWVQESTANWSVRTEAVNADGIPRTTWIPVLRNPNKMIPTRGLSPKPQDRPWPLPAASYEAWRDEIVNKMIKALDAAL